jgi:hypothetical protein
MQYFSMNICLEFSVLFLCSVDVEGRTKRLEEGSRKGLEDTRRTNRKVEESEQIRYKKAAGEGSGRWEGGNWEVRKYRGCKE